MKSMTLENIAKAVGGQLNIGKGNPETEAACVVTDSRQVGVNGIFVAINGERVDGHSFIPQVMEDGALGAICEKKPESDDYPYILVENSYQALKDLAEYYRQQLDIKIVGIIGSVGKTSTKEIVASTLGTHYKVLKTAGNFNNEVGVPLTIFRITDEHEVAVVEMGISDFGEMSRLGKIVKPDMVVMTNIGPCHLEQLGDLDGVLKAKTEVFDYMPQDGVIALNALDEKLKSINKVDGRRIVYYCGEEVYASNVISHGLKGTTFDINIYGEKITAKINLPGEHMVMNALAAAAIGHELNLSLQEIADGISSAEGVVGRNHIIETDRYLVVDDCYNASPKSMRSSIDLMKYADGRTVAILGDMFELGKDELRLHKEVGEYAASNGIDLLICVGERSKSMYEGAVDTIKAAGLKQEIMYFETKEELLSAIGDDNSSILKSGDSILIKASHGMNFTKVVEALTN